MFYTYVRTLYIYIFHNNNFVHIIFKIGSKDVYDFYIILFTKSFLMYK